MGGCQITDKRPGCCPPTVCWEHLSRDPARTGVIPLHTQAPKEEQRRQRRQSEHYTNTDCHGTVREAFVEFTDLCVGVCECVCESVSVQQINSRKIKVNRRHCTVHNQTRRLY